MDDDDLLDPEDTQDDTQVDYGVLWANLVRERLNSPPRKAKTLTDLVEKLRQKKDD